MAVVKTDTDKLISDIEPGGRTVKKLDYGGYLFLEHDIPFLIIYRNIPHDKGTIRLARTGASYLIVGESHFEYFHNIAKQLTDKMSNRFGSFILIEIYSGPDLSSEFVIRGPSHKLPASLNVLKNELVKISSPRDRKNQISVQIEHTKKRINPKHQEFFSIEEIKDRGGTFIGLEIPPLYRNENGNLYPLYFKTFRTAFAKALHKSVFEFIRIQTNSDLKYYTGLGKRKIHDELFKIDKRLTAIEDSYQFLLLVAPVNIESIQERFFETKFDEIQPYHYRLLPIDPDLLKRKLYDLRIDEIDDPALAYLFEEKRKEIDQELTMLQERGSKNFFYSSLRLYKGIEKDVLSRAKTILENIVEEDQPKIKELNAKDFAKIAEKEFDYFRSQSLDFESCVYVRNDINVMMVSKGELYVPSGYTMTKEEASALIQHEVGTHVLTYYNGSQQPLSQLAQGLANYDSLQEGIAVISEYLVGGLTKNRLRIIAGRVIAGKALLDDADFKEVFNLLYSTYGFSKKPAFNITSRVFQGGGFLKDIIYLRGLIRLKEYLQNNGDLEFLLSGKYALEHVPLIKNLIERELLIPPKIKPRYFKDENFKKRMENLRRGIALTNMV